MPSVLPFLSVKMAIQRLWNCGFGKRKSCAWKQFWEVENPLCGDLNFRATKSAQEWKHLPSTIRSSGAAKWSAEVCVRSVGYLCDFVGRLSSCSCNLPSVKWKKLKSQKVKHRRSSPKWNPLSHTIHLLVVRVRIRQMVWLACYRVSLVVWLTGGFTGLERPGLSSWHGARWVSPEVRLQSQLAVNPRQLEMSIWAPMSEWSAVFCTRSCMKKSAGYRRGVLIASGGQYVV